MANVSDPRTDLAWFIWIDRCNSEGLGAARLPGIPSPASLYAQWSERTGRSIRGIEWFELFAVVRYAIILERKFEFMREQNPTLVVPELPGELHSRSDEGGSRMKAVRGRRPSAPGAGFGGS